MPAIALTKNQKLEKLIVKRTRDVRHALKDNKIKQKELAQLAGISEQAIANQFSKDHLTFEVMLAAELLLEEKGIRLVSLVGE